MPAVSRRHVAIWVVLSSNPTWASQTAYWKMTYTCPKKQRHTAKRTFERLRDEHGFAGGCTIVKDYVRERRRHTREMFVPMAHPAGHAQCDFGQAWAVIEGNVAVARVITGPNSILDLIIY